MYVKLNFALARQLIQMPGTGELLYSNLGYYRLVYYNEIYACSAHFGCSENYQGIL